MPRLHRPCVSNDAAGGAALAHFREPVVSEALPLSAPEVQALMAPGAKHQFHQPDLAGQAVPENHCLTPDCDRHPENFRFT